MSAVEKVSVLILSWNGREHLEACLPALERQEDPGVAWEVIVLDNASRDGTAEWIADAHPEARCVRSPVNLGFCAGNNRLVEEADGDVVVLLNNDTRPRPDWLRQLVRTFRGAPEDVAAVSGLIVDWEGERLDFAQGAMTFDGHAFQIGFRTPLADARLPEEGTELPFACGGNMMVRRSSFVEAGGFDADYFAYLEDVDLGWRLWSGGERVIFAPGAVVHHRSGASSDLLGLFNRGFLFERNAFLTAYKNYEDDLWHQVMPAVLLTLTARTQALLEANNPGGHLLRLDPYAGHIADTGVQARDDAPPSPPTPPTPPSEGLVAGLRRRYRQYGGRELLRRGLHRGVDRLLGGAASPPIAAPPRALPEEPRLSDPRTVAQLRALSYLVGHLDQAAEKRAEVQARRKRPDREIFERFPAYLVPTYPGDEELFASQGFEALLPADLPLRRRRLDQMMEL